MFFSNYEYVIISSKIYERFFKEISLKNHPEHTINMRKYYQWLSDNGELIKIFEKQSIYPTIKIYKLKKEKY